MRMNAGDDLKQAILREVLRKGSVPEAAIDMLLALEREVVELKNRVDALEKKGQ